MRQLSIPSTLDTVRTTVSEKTTARSRRERRLREQGYEVVTCPTCGETATRETCMVTRNGRTTREVVLRCWGTPDQGMARGSARCATVVSDARECRRCGNPLEVGAHVNRRYCEPCREVLAGLAGSRRRRAVQQPANTAAACPCGCGRPVRPGRIFHGHGCPARMQRQERPEPSSAQPRTYTCQDCGAEHVHRGRGHVPSRCPNCRAAQRTECRRKKRSAWAPRVRTGSCIDCGAEVRQEGRGGMPQRCPACARETRLAQARGYANRRNQARRRSA